jgi:uncharacterized coiled-coil DUF342 family protein
MAKPASSKMIKRWISDTKKKSSRLERELVRAKTRIRDLEGKMKRAAAAERAGAKKKKAPKKKAKARRR